MNEEKGNSASLALFNFLALTHAINNNFNLNSRIQQIRLSTSKLAFMKVAGTLDMNIMSFIPDFPPVPPPPPGVTFDQVNSDGNFKTSTLRNVELTGPYFHTGGVFTLHNVMDFYQQHGFFIGDNLGQFNIEIDQIAGISAAPEQDDLVSFLVGLTDNRVRQELAPFDHPQLFVPNGQVDAAPAQDIMLEIPAVGTGCSHQCAGAAKIPVRNREEKKSV